MLPIVTRVLLAALAWTVMWTTASAHRPGESYVYLRVEERALSGEIHVRLSDLDKAVPLDADGDGWITPEEYDLQADAVERFLAERLIFHIDGPHRPVFTGRTFFAESKPQVALPFVLPDVGAVPDVIEVEYRFLYDGPDPEHRPMLLFSYNPRMKLEENEAAVSLVFGRGYERQQLSMLPRPRAEIARGFVRYGMHEVLDSPQRLIFALALLLPAVMTVQGGRWRPREPAWRAAPTAAAWFAIFAVGFAATLSLQHFAGVSAGRLGMAAAPALSVILLAAHNVRPWGGWAGRALLILALGLLQGLGSIEFSNMLGPEEGFAEAAMVGFTAGIWLGLAVVAAVALPGFAMLRRTALLRVAALRFGSMALGLVAAAWFVERAFFA